MSGMALRWSIPLPGPFSLGGRVGSGRPSTAGADLARELERRAERREEAAVRDEAFRADLAGRIEAAWPDLNDEQRVALEREVTKLAALPHGSLRSELRGGAAIAVLDRAVRDAARTAPQDAPRGRHRG